MTFKHQFWQHKHQFLGILTAKIIPRNWKCRCLAFMKLTPGVMPKQTPRLPSFCNVLYKQPTNENERTTLLQQNSNEKNTFVNLKSNSALKSNKGHNLLKGVFPSNNIK